MDINKAIFDYDSEQRILHLSASELLSMTNQAELKTLCGTIQTFLDENSGGRPGYMIVDLTRISIDPSLAPAYAEHLGQMIDRYVYGDGIARYGFGITRVTAQVGHDRIGGHSGDDSGDPSLFRTRDEARAHIQTVISRRQAAEANSKT